MPNSLPQTQSVSQPQPATQPEPKPQPQPASHAQPKPQPQPTSQPEPASQPDPRPSHPAPQQVDVLAIGAGPFNLGFAALAQPLVESGELSLAVFDKRDGFCWHPGMMLPTATIQVPFMADLVTMADPTSPYSFLNYCKQQGRIHHFFIKEDFYPLRAEYSDYCAWVARQLGTLHWKHCVDHVDQLADGTFTVTYSHPGGTGQIHARHLVIGVGTEPFVPDDLAAALNAPNVLHSADYLHRKQQVLSANSITIIGSGQSAAEIYLDLIEERAEQGKRLDWFTRSPRFFPMEYTKLTLEMTSPDYARYFHALPEATRDRTNREQRSLYKGISGDTVNEIYDTLYRLSRTGNLPSTLRAGCAVAWAPGAEPTDGSTGVHRLRVEHTESGSTGVHASDALILATGYRAPTIPPFLSSVHGSLNVDAAGRCAVGTDFSINDAGTVHVQNAEEHTHSLISPDLGMGPWRNSIILASITGREVYPIEKDIAFQTFGGEGL